MPAAVTDAYATFAQYQASAHYSGSDSQTTIESQLLAVSRFLDREAGQFFTKDAAAVARIYRGSGDKILDLDIEGCPGIATQSGLVIKVDEDDDGVYSDETALTNSTLLILPLNADRGSQAKPWTTIELTDRSRIEVFPKDQLIEVTAVFGWPAVPGLVTETTIELTAIWRNDSPRATGRVNELEQAISSSPLAMSLVKRFLRAYSKAVVA